MVRKVFTAILVTRFFISYDWLVQVCSIHSGLYLMQIAGRLDLNKNLVYCGLLTNFNCEDHVVSYLI